MKKLDIPKWMKITEAKAVIEANGQNIYFKDLEDAKKVYAFVVNYCHAHRQKVDSKRPRLLKMGKDKDAIFVAVDKALFEAQHPE